MSFRILRKICNRLFSERSVGFFAAVLFVICIVMIIAGLRPFDFHPVNKVSWLRDANGVHFYGQGMIVSPLLWDEQHKSPFQGKAITIEMRVRAADEPSDVGIGRLLLFYDGQDPDVLFLGQWKTHLDIQSRLRTIRRRFERPVRNMDYKEAGLPDALTPGHDRFLTVTSGEDGTLIYSNGQLAKTYPRHNVLSGFTGTPFRLIIGNASDGEDYWTGYISGLAIYNSILTHGQVLRSYEEWQHRGTSTSARDNGCIALYLFDERKGKVVYNHLGGADNLTIPEVFVPVRRVFLSDPWKDFTWSRSFFQDIAINVIGFMPFGFFCAAFLHRISRVKKSSAFISVALIGFIFSLAIEITQAYIPTRHSQVSDVICNFIGTVLGQALFYKTTFKVSEDNDV